jgi:TRAP-type C4-dicarboxylate transport system permease small subunit
MPPWPSPFQAEGTESAIVPAIELDRPRQMNRHQAQKLFDRLRVAQLRLASAALIIMMLVTVADVTLRYVFNSPIRGSYELVQVMLVIFVFNGMSTAFLQRRNIVIDLIDNFVHRYVIIVLTRISDVLTIAVVALFAYAMITPALQSFSYGEMKMELQIPIWWMWAIALVGIAGAILCAIGALLAPATTHHDEPV